MWKDTFRFQVCKYANETTYLVYNTLMNSYIMGGIYFIVNRVLMKLQALILDADCTRT